MLQSAHPSPPFNKRACSVVITAALLTAPMAASVYPLAAWAQGSAAQYDFNIAGGNLENAIADYARVTGANLSFEPTTTLAKRSMGVKGHLTGAAALHALLQGTGLQALERSANSYTLVASDEHALQLQPTDVNASAGWSGTVSEGTGSYTTGQVTLGKTPQSIKDTPQTVSVMTRQRIEDQGLNSINDVMLQTTGITPYQGSLTNSRYLSRGFEITSYRVDGGAPIDNATYSPKDHDMAIYDRVEVLRGSDGLFSGAGEPGGTINLVRKKPTFENQYGLETSVGSWHNYRTQLDVSGPLALDGKVRGRTVVVYNNRDMFYDTANAERSLFYGVIEADITDTTTVLAGLTNDDAKSADQAYGWPRALDGADLKLPRSTFLGGAHDYKNSKTQSYFATLNQQLGERWAATLDTTVAVMDQDRSYYNFYGAIDPATGAGSAANWQGQQQGYYSRAYDLNVKGSETLGGFENDFLLGASWTNNYFGSDHRQGAYREIDNIHAFDPHDYPSSASDSAFSYRDVQRIEQKGLYGSWRIHIAEPLHLIVGTRYSNYEQRYTRRNANGSSSGTFFRDRDVLTPFYGATYALSPAWSLYFSRADIYKSQASLRDRSGAPLQPITGVSNEFGIKGELFDGRVNTYAAIYYVNRDGEGIYDRPGDTSDCCYRDGGKNVSKGVDLEVSGQLAEGLQATLGYTFNTTRNNIAGNAYNTVTPKHLFKLFATYQLPGALNKFKVGGGVVAQTPAFVSGTVYARGADGELEETSNTYAFSQAGYALWNAHAEYALDTHWTVSLNANNLTDKKYYSTVGMAEYGNFYGEPRNYLLTIRAKY